MKRIKSMKQLKAGDFILSTLTLEGKEIEEKWISQIKKIEGVSIFDNGISLIGSNPCENENKYFSDDFEYDFEDENGKWKFYKLEENEMKKEKLRITESLI